MNRDAKPSSSQTKPFLPVPVPPAPICLGGAPFGSNLDKATSFAILDAYAELGGNLFDTAYIYGAWAEGLLGASEKTIGEWIRVNGGREKLIVTTKGGHPPLSNLTEQCCTPDVLRQNLAESLDRLGVDTIDIYLLHRDNPERPVEPIMETLAEFVRAGSVNCYVASNWSCARIEAANAYAKTAGIPPFVASQIGLALAEFSLPNPPIPGMLYFGAEAQAWHIAKQFPLIPFSSQAHGYFGAENAHWAKNGFAGDAPMGDRDYDSPKNRRRLLSAMALAEQKNCTANQIGLAYVMAHPFPVIPVIGALEPSHVVEAMGACSVHLTEDEVASLESA
jgi:aryl-alcohol dehydrogenase-like predicted oxidoreductase